MRTGTQSCSPLYHHHMADDLTHRRFSIHIDLMGEETKEGLRNTQVSWGPSWAEDFCSASCCPSGMQLPYPPKTQAPTSESRG